MLAVQLPQFRYVNIMAGWHLFLKNPYTQEQVVLDISSRIPEDERNSVFSYNIGASWYDYADIFPCIKYCDWQNHYISLVPEIYDELEHIFSVQPPAWLVLPQEKGKMPLFLENMIGVEYLPFYENESYILYQYVE